MAGDGFKMDGYNTVPERIVEFRAKYPDGTLQPLNLDRPYEIVKVGGVDKDGKDTLERTFIIYTAAAYRTPDDPRPGVGIAWEPFPGHTNFTRFSEIQNAETSAWGRALIAVGAADARKGIASAEEVRNRSQSPDDEAPPEIQTDTKDLMDRFAQLTADYQDKVARRVYKAGKDEDQPEELPDGWSIPWAWLQGDSWKEFIATTIGRAEQASVQETEPDTSGASGANETGAAGANETGAPSAEPPADDPPPPPVVTPPEPTPPVAQDPPAERPPGTGPLSWLGDDASDDIKQQWAVLVDWVAEAKGGPVQEQLRRLGLEVGGKVSELRERLLNGLLNELLLSGETVDDKAPGDEVEPDEPLDESAESGTAPIETDDEYSASEDIKPTSVQVDVLKSLIDVIEEEHHFDAWVRWKTERQVPDDVAQWSMANVLRAVDFFERIGL